MSRGVCPVCGREYSVTKTGKIRSHRAPAWKPGDPARDLLCRGSVLPPDPVVEDPLEAAFAAIEALKTDVVAAEARGYDRAITLFRAHADWCQANGRPVEAKNARDDAAWLEANRSAELALRGEEHQ